MIEIPIRCHDTHYLTLQELTVLQEAGEAPLKELSPEGFDKIKHSLETKGFWFPDNVLHAGH